MTKSSRFEFSAILDDLSGASPVTTPATRGGEDYQNDNRLADFQVRTRTDDQFPPRGESSDIYDRVFNKAKTSSSQGAKKYKIWCHPVTDKIDTCLGLIGQGSTFCTIEGCNKRHQSSQLQVAIPGEAYVAKSSDAAFTEPVIRTSLLSEDLLSKWKNLSCTLDDWIELFDLASSTTTEDDPGVSLPRISSEDLQLKNKEVTKVLTFKTPKKDPRNSDLLMSTSLILPEFEQLQVSESDSFSASHVLNLDSKVELIHKSFQVLTTQHQELFVESRSSLQNLDLRVERISSGMGSKPLNMEHRFEAPNLWSSLALVADELSTVSLFQSKDIERIRKDLNHTDALLSKIDSSTAIKQLHDRLDNLEEFAVESAKRLNANISAAQSTFNDPSTTNGEILSRIKSLEKEMSQVRATSDHTVIQYAKLGFRSQSECDSWIELHQPKGDYGLLMDFHTVLEHAHLQLAGQKILPNLQSIYKMKLQSNNQAVAMTSFEDRIPKFFGGEGRTVNIVREDDSYFKSIRTWEDWNMPNDGLRDQLKRELTVFEIGHKETLDAELESLSLFHTLCCKSLTDSISWAHGIIKFIDDTYREYSRAHFSTKKAWHVTTKLAISMIQYIAKPRNVVHNSFKIHDPRAIGKVISFSNFRSLDRMMEIYSLEFKNSPVVTAELTKFLALNTNYNAVEKLQKQMLEVTETCTKVTKEAQAATKSANTVGNTVDGVKGDIKSLLRRVKTLEPN